MLAEQGERPRERYGRPANIWNELPNATLRDAVKLSLPIETSSLESPDLWLESMINAERAIFQKEEIATGMGSSTPAHDARSQGSERAGPQFAASLLGILQNSAIGRPVETTRNRCLFTQGEKAEAVYVLQIGRVKVSSITSNGKQVIVTICNPGDLVGEECLVGCTTRRTNATAMESGSCFVIHRVSMLNALHKNPDLLDQFMKHVLRRNLRLQGDVASGRSQPAEHRLARVLLHLAGPERGNPDGLLPRISHEELAEMVGTTRPRITQFLVKMKETGYIVAQGPMRVDRKLLGVLLD